MQDSLNHGLRIWLQGCCFNAETTSDIRRNAFDIGLWKSNTSLGFFGAKLQTSSGSAKVRLWHEQANGVREEIALLDRPSPGASFSPPLELDALAVQGGQVLPELLSVQDGEEGPAAFSLYFGTNDLPSTPAARVAFVLPPQGGVKAERDVQKRFADVLFSHPELRGNTHCVLLHSAQDAPPHPEVLRLPFPRTHWMRHVGYEIAYGSLNNEGITHLAILPEKMTQMSRQDLEEMVLRSLAFAHLMHDGASIHREQPWPNVLVDVHQIYLGGLPLHPVARYIARLSPNYSRSLREVIATLPQRIVIRKPPQSRNQIHFSASSQARRNAKQCFLDLEQRLSVISDHTRLDADRERANRLALSLLRNRHEGQRAVIIGNGPSLQISDLDRLHSEVTFASNKIYLAYDTTRWRPTYYSVEDHLVLLNNLADIVALQGSIKIFPANTRDFGYHAADTIFAPFLPPRSFEDPLSDPAFPAFSTDLTHGISWGSTIIYSQIQMAVFMGCSEIVLIGVDHSYQLPPVKRGNQYVYAGEQNHFHPKYRNPGETWHTPNLDILEVSYARALEVCKQKSIQIVNASRRTALDVYDRADFDELFPPTENPA